MVASRLKSSWFLAAVEVFICLRLGVSSLKELSLGLGVWSFSFKVSEIQCWDLQFWVQGSLSSFAPRSISLGTFEVARFQSITFARFHGS